MGGAFDYEGQEEIDIALCQLRTGNGKTSSRAVTAGKEGRTVRLDYPDDMRLRRQLTSLPCA
jgi:hypothetical protein